jgi:NADH:ubiquinone oxidoreductase subunit H
MVTQAYSIFAVALLGPVLGLLVLGILSLFLERKLIGIAQKRLGISFLGRNG